MRSIWGENLKERIPVHDELDSFIQSWPLVYICVWGCDYEPNVVLVPQICAQSSLMDL